MHTLLRLAAALCVLLCAPIASAQTNNPIQTASNASPAPPSASPAANDYALGSGDEIRVTVFGEADVSGDYLVDAQGNVTLPLIGAVPATGSPPTVLAQVIASRLSSGSFVQNARVTASVIAYRPFYILGEVQRPGAYPYAPDMSLLNAVATAGGYTPRANTRRIYLRRAGQSTEQRVSADGVQIRPGDTVRIGERFF